MHTTLVQPFELVGQNNPLFRCHSAFASIINVCASLAVVAVLLFFSTIFLLHVLSVSFVLLVHPSPTAKFVTEPKLGDSYYMRAHVCVCRADSCTYKYTANICGNTHYSTVYYICLYTPQYVAYVILVFIYIYLLYCISHIKDAVVPLMG